MPFDCTMSSMRSSHSCHHQTYLQDLQAHQPKHFLDATVTKRRILSWVEQGDKGLLSIGNGTLEALTTLTGEIVGGLNKVARRLFKVSRSAPDMRRPHTDMWHPTLVPATSESTGRSCSRPPSSLATHVAPFALWT